jgi:hypothetical protein
MIRPGWERIVVVASGPSLKDGDYAQPRLITQQRGASDAFRVIVVNDNWKWIRNADLLYASDMPWWNHHGADVLQSDFAGERWTQDPAMSQKWGAHYIAQKRVPGLTRTECLLHGGGNSGHQAIQLAYLLGADEIALVGFDMMPDPTTTEIHHFGDHPMEVRFGTDRRKWPRNPRRLLPFHVFLERMDVMAPGLKAMGVQVSNCTTRTAITCFARADLKDTLARWVGA